MTDDEIALKLMRLYSMLRAAYDPDIRQSVCEAIDQLVANLKQGTTPASPALSGPPPPVQRKLSAGD